jgi:WD40 repeat protein
LHDVGDIRDVAFSPDGTLIATAGGNDHTVLLFNANNGEQVRILAGDSVVDAVAFSLDGKRLATGSNLFDPNTGEQLRHLAGGAYDVAFSPDGALVATANGYQPNGVRLFNTSTGELVRVLTTEYASALAFSPDGKLLATTTGYRSKGVVLWNVATGEQVRTVGSGVSFGVAFSPGDGRFLATSGDRKIQLWNPTTGEHIRDIDASVIHGFSPDGKLAATGQDRAVRLYDPATGNPILTLTNVYAAKIAFSPDGKRLAAVSPDHTLRVVSTA